MIKRGQTKMSIFDEAMEKSGVKKHKLIKELILDGVVEPVGNEVHALKVTTDMYKVFHRTGWWAIPAEYFE